MDCLKCGGTYTERTGTYSVVDPYVGEIILDGFSYYQCDKCGDILYSAAMAREIDSQRNKRIHEIIHRFPIGDFITAADTASILGISRQALHKNKRISHGFIYQTKCGRTTQYLKQSVQQYKKFSDGRFPLHIHRPTSSTEYVKPSVSSRTSAAYEAPRTPIAPMRQAFKRTRAGLQAKEYSYAT